MSISRKKITFIVLCKRCEANNLLGKSVLVLVSVELINLQILASFSQYFDACMVWRMCMLDGTLILFPSALMVTTNLKILSTQFIGHQA